MKSQNYFTFSKLIFQLIAYIGITNNSIGQIYGCMDPLSQNFNPQAEINDGSCYYISASISNITSISLSDSLSESSGLIQWNGLIWSQNDNDDNFLYAINPNNGTIDSTILIPAVINTDWEEISQDENYIYLGDFGNNSQGNRTDLHVLRILKSELSSDLQIDTIYFHYPEQIDFSPQTSNTTNFDCEAFVVTSDSIFLFTKQWGNKRTKLYGFPKIPGNYPAILKDSFDIQGLITGATYLENERLISICGYSTSLQPFIWLLYDFDGTNFFKGNKRKLNLPLSFTQIEAITSDDGLNYFASNEYLSNGPIVSPQRFHAFNLSMFLEGYLTGNYALINESSPNKSFSISPNPSLGSVEIQSTENLNDKCFSIFNTAGQLVNSGKISNYGRIELLNKGLYFVKIDGFTRKIIIE